MSDAPLDSDTVYRAVAFIREMIEFGREDVALDILIRLESRLLSDRLQRSDCFVMSETESEFLH